MRDAVFADIAKSQIKQGDLDQALLTADRIQDPQAWLTDILSRIADDKIARLDELLPWRYAQH
jgi:hypothetical protein